jgi:predicted kinase
MGYPGSGKTTAAHFIHELTGATHIWADRERSIMFAQADYGPQETRQLYSVLDRKVESLISQGSDVIYDTNFNFRRDRDRMRAMAGKAGALLRLIWVKTDKALSKERALSDQHMARNKFTRRFPDRDFERMTRNLEPASPDENPIIINGENMTMDDVAKILQVHAV